MIDRKFFKKKSKEISKKDIKKACKCTAGALIKVKENKNFVDILGEFRTMVTLLDDYRLGKYKKIPWTAISMIAFSLIYLANPFDLIPDIAPVIGFVDDAGVMGLCVKAVHKDLFTYKIWKHGNEKL